MRWSALCQTCLFAFGPSAESGNDCFALYMSFYLMTSLSFTDNSANVLWWFSYGHAVHLAFAVCSFCVVIGIELPYIHKPFILSSWQKDNMREGLCCGTWLPAMMRLLHQLSCLGEQILTVGKNWIRQEWLVFCHLIITNLSLPYWGFMWGPLCHCFSNLA